MSMTQPTMITREEFARRSFIRDKKVIGDTYAHYTWKTLPIEIKNTYYDAADLVMNDKTLVFPENWSEDLWDNEYWTE